MPGCLAWKRPMASGSTWVATLEKVPMTSEPVSMPTTSRTRSARRRSSSQSASTKGMMSLASAVSRTPRRPRSSSVTPHSRSRSAIMRLTPDWL